MEIPIQKVGTDEEDNDHKETASCLQPETQDHQLKAPRHLQGRAPRSHHQRHWEGGPLYQGSETIKVKKDLKPLSETRQSQLTSWPKSAPVTFTEPDSCRVPPPDRFNAAYNYQVLEPSELRQNYANKELTHQLSRVEEETITHPLNSHTMDEVKQGTP